MKKKIIPGTIPTPDLHQYLLGSVSPRPIAFVSTIDEQGRKNLAPYSFFNAFSSNPPILVFSSNRRVQDNTTKDTLHNIQLNMECVVNVVSYNIVRQMMISSVDFPTGVNEFEQAGLHEEAAEMVKPPMVLESPVNMECRVKEIITLGDKGGAGHLIVCDVVCMHIEEGVLDEQGRIDPHKIDLMGRMGRAFYVRASGEAVQSMPQTQTLPIIGYPQLPLHIRQSKILSANDIGILSGLRALPNPDEIKTYLTQYREISELSLDEIHQKAKEFIAQDKFQEALMLLMCKS
ncbi:MAG: flavin reductase family protein [Saprospiraceae bacterium]|nr:flavin reductase family protein [Saprospiraceae bacterium]